MPDVTIHPDDAAALEQLRARHHQAQADAEGIVDPARRAFYTKLLEVVDGNGRSKATQEELAAQFGVHRSRVQQLVAQARKALE